MSWQLKDYAHLYLGQPCVNGWFPETHDMYNNGWKLVGIDLESQRPYRVSTEDDFTWSQDIKLILSPLTWLTEEDLQKIAEQEGGTNEGLTIHQTVEALARALNRLRGAGYDCDGLIAAGLAIDKTTVNQQP